MRRGVD